ncbi:50S ribosomal protein L11 methyltransferase [Thiovibrio sp. JS02]
MLRPPYTSYSRLYTYHLDRRELPAFSDPDLIGVWMEDENAILFFHRPKERLVAALCAESGARVIYEADLDYQDWEAGREIGPFSVGDFTVAPVWEKTPADVLLDPSVIFGSGFHPSTRLCLGGLLKYSRAPEITLNTALDLGCGTGLLAIAAARQGITRITACDNNPLACEVARANVRRNKVEGEVTVLQADLRSQCPDTRVDLVMANLYKGLMLDLFRNPDFWRARLYLLSGFISGMEEELLAALPQQGLKFLERGRNDRWCFWALLNSRF